MRCNEDIRAIAKKQLLQADALLPLKQKAGPSRPPQTAAAAAVLSRSISSGRIEGKARELHWTVWGGRYMSSNSLSRHAFPLPPPLCMAHGLTCSARLSTAWHRQWGSLCVSSAWHMPAQHGTCHHSMADVSTAWHMPAQHGVVQHLQYVMSYVSTTWHSASHN